MKRTIVILLSLFVTGQVTAQDMNDPIARHPDNGHYFIYKGDAMVLVTSAEHYGAVLNTDFDYRTYLQTLAADSMNYTRIFAGSYFEIPGTSFGIRNNTLAPEPSAVLTPWKVTKAGGSAQYQLGEWNEAYFTRLRDFLSLARDLDIIVEVTFFSSVYTDEHWKINPQNPENTPDLEGTLDRQMVHTLENGELLAYQETYVRKLVGELNAFPNVFYEIQNEPWSDRPVPVYNIVNKEELQAGDWTNKADFADSLAMAWQAHMVNVIVEAERNLPRKHLIAQNYTNFRAPIPEVGEHVDILNFHYAWPEAVWWNYHYDKVLGFDESGFAGSGDMVYRRQAWQFLLSGGALFNNLDYSFAVGHEQGDLENEAPGGGSAVLRRQLRYLRRFMQQLPLENMGPAQELVTAAPGMIPYVLSDTGHNVTAIYLRLVGTERSGLQLGLPAGEYAVTYVDPVSGEELEMEFAIGPGSEAIPVQSTSGELALHIRRVR